MTISFPQLSWPPEWKGVWAVVSFSSLGASIFLPSPLSFLCFLQNWEGGERRKGAGKDLLDWCCSSPWGLTVDWSRMFLPGFFATSPSLFLFCTCSLLDWELCVFCWFLHDYFISQHLAAHLLRGQLWFTGNSHIRGHDNLGRAGHQHNLSSLCPQSS